MVDDPWSGANPPPSCKPDTKIDKKIGKTETFKDGTKVELWCKAGTPANPDTTPPTPATAAQFVMKITKPDGTVGYSGKCAYTYGKNSWSKTWRGTVVLDDKGDFLRGENKKLIETFFETRDAHNPNTAKPFQFVTNKDTEWKYDHETGKVTERKTTHHGMWLATITTTMWFAMGLGNN